MKCYIHYLILLTVFLAVLSGCAEGMFWRSGYLSPWVRQRWSAEEEIAATLFSRRAEMRQMVEEATVGGESIQQAASDYLADVITNDPVLLLRIEATQLIGDLQNETALNALQVACRDRQVEVRRAAVQSLQQMGSKTSEQLLAQMALEDADVDVRISATAALGSFQGEEARQALAQVIDDPNPALQLRAAESLARVTGKSFGKDIQAWQAYLQQESQAAAETELTADDAGKQQPPVFR